MTAQRFAGTKFLIIKQFFKIFGGAFRIFDPLGNLVLFADMKAFRLKEDIRLFGDEAKTEEILNIQARSIIDFAAAYDVYDSVTQEKVGALKRKGFKSILQDEWIIMDAMDNEIGVIKEDSMLMASLRRFLTNLIPQKFHGEIGGRPVCSFKQHFNPFVLKLDCDFSEDYANSLDRRLGLAAAVLLCAIEGRQN